jgi:hypothetical protein
VDSPCETPGNPTRRRAELLPEMLLGRIHPASEGSPINHQPKKGLSMTVFNLELLTDQPDRIYVEIDRRFNVVIERTETGLELRVYPLTKGEIWDAPFDTFEVDEAEILALEQEMEE